jgi:hypothetical protein
MTRRNPTEYGRDWQDAERRIREVRGELEKLKPFASPLHRKMHRLVFLSLRQAELYCELLRAKELMGDTSDEPTPDL